MERVEMVARRGDQIVSIGYAWMYDPKSFARRHNKIRRDHKEHATTAEKVAFAFAALFFVACVIVYLETGGIR